jgi:hypothetical protein
MPERKVAVSGMERWADAFLSGMLEGGAVAGGGGGMGAVVLGVMTIGSAMVSPGSSAAEETLLSSRRMISKAVAGRCSASFARQEAIISSHASGIGAPDRSNWARRSVHLRRNRL